MWNDKRVSVILPTYNEKESIRQCVVDFFDTTYVDEVVVVNNNAAEGTSDEVRGTGCVEVFEERQGYGWSCQKGLEVATGDLFILCEPDGTFEPKDIHKLLVYADDFEYVLGTRTTKEFIWTGANMGFFLKWGNYAVAKLMEFLFNCSILTDVGCTMRLISRQAYRRVKDAIKVGDSRFGPHLTLLVIAAKIPFTEISVHYRARVGKSAVTGNFRKAVRLGVAMIFMILRFRVVTALGFRKDRGLIPVPAPVSNSKIVSREPTQRMAPIAQDTEKEEQLEEVL